MGLLYLGQCYERGVGVKQCLGTAANLYRQAAAAGNQKAKGLLMDMCHREGNDENGFLSFFLLFHREYNVSEHVEWFVCFFLSFYHML